MGKFLGIKELRQGYRILRKVNPPDIERQTQVTIYIIRIYGIFKPKILMDTGYPEPANKASVIRLYCRKTAQSLEQFYMLLVN